MKWEQPLCLRNVYEIRIEYEDFSVASDEETARARMFKEDVNDVREFFEFSLFAPWPGVAGRSAHT